MISCSTFSLSTFYLDFTILKPIPVPLFSGGSPPLRDKLANISMQDRRTLRRDRLLYIFFLNHRGSFYHLCYVVFLFFSIHTVILQENMFEENQSFYSMNLFAQQNFLNLYLLMRIADIYNL
jgi:hypothetical protein